MVEETQPPESPEDALRKTIAALANQVGLLAGEVRRMRRQAEHSSLSIELLLAEERLSRVEEKLDTALGAKAQLDAREQDLMRRLRNPRQELIGRPVLRPDDAEAAVRAELNRALEETRSQQGHYQSRITELQNQATRLKARIAELQKKLEAAESNQTR